jgi:hypothetical protein
MERQPPVTGIALVAGLCTALDAERWMTNALTGIPRT